MLILLFVFALWILPVWVAAQVTSGRGRGTAAGVILGMFLGWIGVLIALLLGRQAGATGQEPAAVVAQHPRRNCPHCKESMRRDARVCSHCRLESQAWTLHYELWWVTTNGGQWNWFDESAREWRQISEPPPSDPGSETPPASAEDRAAQRRCPYCKELMPRLDRTCPHCGQDSQPWTLWDGAWWVRVNGGEWQWQEPHTGQWRTVPPARDLARGVH